MTPFTLCYLLHRLRLRPDQVAAHLRIPEAEVKRLMARYGIGPFLR